MLLGRSRRGKASEGQPASFPEPLPPTYTPNFQQPLGKEKPTTAKVGLAFSTTTSQKIRNSGQWFPEQTGAAWPSSPCSVLEPRKKLFLWTLFPTIPQRARLANFPTVAATPLVTKVFLVQILGHLCWLDSIIIEPLELTFSLQSLV